ncbi:MAG: stage III sporulation protein AG, partial [Lachnospiraceae bacterium]|nr:stage III sporulation protein AG [Lachnospiraceae bacterium]
IFYTDENGRENPYCQKIITPRVEGVVVVAEGGDDPGRIIEITDVIQSLFDVPVHKIRVVRMKSE